MPDTPAMPDDRVPTRRTVLRGAAVAAAATVPLFASATSAEAKPKPPKKKKKKKKGDPKGKPIAATKDIPVGGGKYFEKDQLIVAQPKKGKFNAFNSTCSHANCPVSDMETKGKMICPCHNAEFDLDGKPVKGVARRPLKPEKIVVAGGKIYKA